MNKTEAWGEGDVITGLSQAFMDEFEAEIKGRVPAEKVAMQLRMERTARINKQIGSINIPTLGQKIAQIPARLYFRWMQDQGQGDFSSDEAILDLLADNEMLCCPGFKPKRKADLRHSKSFVNGKPV